MPMELMIPLKTQGGVPLYEQIYEYIKKEIRTGNLTAGKRLPSTRRLAEYLKVSRSTTQMAYEQLMSEGYIETVPCKGYYVLQIDEMQEIHPAGSGEDAEEGRGCEAGGEGSPEDAVIWGEEGGMSVSASADSVLADGSSAWIDFSPRGIDLSHFPYNDWRKVTRNALVEDNRELFLSGSPQGDLAFRKAIRQYLHSARGVECRPEQIVIGAGSEYLLMLLSRILGQEAVIAMENPTYLQASRVLESLHHPMALVEMDSYGMDVRKLETSGAEVAYIMPSHQYPMGIVMPIKRRQELLSWAQEKEGRYLIEDDYDSEFRYRGKPVPAMQGMDRQGKVIYMGTFSKSIAPAIRVGYLVLPERLLEIYRQQFGFYASTVSRIDQDIQRQFLEDGYYEKHLNRMRAIYRRKHDLLMAQLRGLEDDFDFQGEYAGLHLLLTCKRRREEGWLIRKAAEASVKVYGLSGYLDPVQTPEDRYGSTVLLGYANLTEEEITEGIRRLKAAWV